MRSPNNNNTIRWICLAAIAAVCGWSTVSAFGLASCKPASSRFFFSAHSAAPMQATIDDNNCDECCCEQPIPGCTTMTRRETFRTAAASLAAAALACAPGAAVAAVAREEIFAKLSGIPTFCLVNGPGSQFEGVPFGIFDRSTATATGYFFFNYETAQQALKAASDIDAVRGDGNIWATAQIKVVPLSIALQLSMVRRQRVAVNEEKGVNGIKVETVHNLIPSEDGNADAKTLDTNRKQNFKKWETKGRVPLFSIPDGNSRKYFFETNDLVADYKASHSKEDPSMAFLPEIQLDEMVYVFRQALQSNDWDSLLDFANTIQPLPEARADAIKLLTQEASSKTPAAPYNFDKIFLVVSAK